MAGRGPTPKDPSQRRYRPPKAAEPPRRRLSAPPSSAPALPHSERYSADTLEWYAVWCRSPQASRFTPTDWQRLHLLAPLVDAYVTEPKQSLMAEIRLNESLLGATEADRLRLRWDVETPGGAESAPAPVDDAARRARILKLAGRDGA
jgi:hypothetical protein